VLAEIEPPVQKQILGGLDNQLVSDILQQLPSDDAVDILGKLSKERTRDIMNPEVIFVHAQKDQEEVTRLLPKNPP
jgi:Mg/Co/Ni transporter MgtE